MRKQWQARNRARRIQAKCDWDALADLVQSMGHAELARKYRPKKHAGYRAINGRIDRLRGVLRQERHW